MEKQRWAVVLAGGLGARLQEMTGRRNGLAVPKQYCSMYGGPSLLRLALARALATVPRDRVLCVVASEHRQWWSRELCELPAENVIVQPYNRGTAVGTLLALLVGRSRDRSSRIMFMPADHYVEDEQVFASGISAAFDAIETHTEKVILLGLEPDEPETELGYILAEPNRHAGVRQVTRFIEKPGLRQAKSLVELGALWNSFVFGAEVNTLLALFRRRMPDTLSALRTLAADPLDDPRSLAFLYGSLEHVDLSTSVFTGSESDLAVLGVSQCGWTDLGTPERVVRCLSDHTTTPYSANTRYPNRPTHVDLASVCSNTSVPLRQ